MKSVLFLLHVKVDVFSTLLNVKFLNHIPQYLMPYVIFVLPKSLELGAYFHLFFEVQSYLFDLEKVGTNRVDLHKNKRK